MQLWLTVASCQVESVDDLSPVHAQEARPIDRFVNNNVKHGLGEGSGARAGVGMIIHSHNLQVKTFDKSFDLSDTSNVVE